MIVCLSSVVCCLSVGAFVICLLLFVLVRRVSLLCVVGSCSFMFFVVVR